MKLRRIFAALAACAIAATSVISASADDSKAITSKIGDSIAEINSDGSGKITFTVAGGEAKDGVFKDVDFTKIASIELTLSWADADEVWAGGSVALQTEGNTWDEVGQWTKGADPSSPKAFENVESGKAFTVKVPDDFKADTWYKICIQNYGVPVSVDKIVLKDAAGTVLFDSAAPAANNNNSNNNGDKKDNSNKPTGASAGLALAGLALAGVAVVATKKSK